MGDEVEAARRHDDAFNAKDASVRPSIETQDVEVVLPGIAVQGTEQALQLVTTFWEAVPDAHLSHEAEIVSGDTVVFEGLLTGTHTGTLRTPQGDVPASGRPVSLRYAAVKRIRDGKVASDHVYFDRLEFMEQIGVAPGP